MHYCGFLRPTQKDVLQEFEERIYTVWASSKDAGPAQRPRSEQEQPTLGALCWQQHVPTMPQTILQKFPAGTPQHGEIQAMQKKLAEIWPRPAEADTGTGAQPGPSTRMNAMLDLTKTSFIDTGREISPAYIAVAGFSARRHTVCLR